MPNRSRSGPGEQPRARGRADEREPRQVQPDRACCRPLADDDVEREVLHRRVEHLLDHAVEAVDLVDEEHVALFEVGEYRGQVAGPLDRRSAGRLELHSQLVGDDLRERGLAEPRRTREQHVVERLVALPRCIDQDAEVVLDARLAQVLVADTGDAGAVDLEVVLDEPAGDEPLGLVRVDRIARVGGLPYRAHRPLPSRCNAYLRSACGSPAAPSYP